MISLAEQRAKSPSAKWYILRTTPHSDFQAASELTYSGFEVFSPRVKTPRGSDCWQDVPLFPGYLFLKWDLERGGKPSLIGAPHVSGWVHFEGECPSVPDEVVAKLAERVNAMNSEGGLWRRFKPGEKVRVVSKAIECLAEVLEDAKTPQAQVKVLMHFMGRLVSAQVPWYSLQPVEEHIEIKARPPRRTRGRGRWIHKSNNALAHSSRS